MQSVWHNGRQKFLMPWSIHQKITLDLQYTICEHIYYTWECTTVMNNLYSKVSLYKELILWPNCIFFCCKTRFLQWWAFMSQSSGLWHHAVLWWDTNILEGNGTPSWNPTISRHDDITQKTMTWTFFCCSQYSISSDCYIKSLFVWLSLKMRWLLIIKVSYFHNLHLYIQNSYSSIGQNPSAEVGWSWSPKATLICQVQWTTTPVIRLFLLLKWGQ
jgi:hypothetical protein